jgi:hypothetical protein
MNPEILRKCLSGKANDAEMEAYHHWLEGHPDEEERDVEMAADDLAPTHLWQHIQEHNSRHDRYRIRQKGWLYTGIAASLLVGCLLIFFPGRYTQQQAGRVMQFSHQDNAPSSGRMFNGIAVKLGAASEVTLQDIQNNHLGVQFEGSLVLSNTTSEDRTTEISYIQTDGHSASKKLLLRKGRTYLLAYYPYKADKLVVVENRSLMDMPPALAMHVNNEFVRL